MRGISPTHVHSSASNAVLKSGAGADAIGRLSDAMIASPDVPFPPRPTEMRLPQRVNSCLAASQQARLLYLQKLPR